jgi:hypothetical protein
VLTRCDLRGSGNVAPVRLETEQRELAVAKGHMLCFASWRLMKVTMVKVLCCSCMVSAIDVAEPGGNELAVNKRCSAEAP